MILPVKHLVACRICRTGCRPSRPGAGPRPMEVLECDCKRLSWSMTDGGPVWVFRTHGPGSPDDGEAIVRLDQRGLRVAYDYGGDLEWAAVSEDDSEALVDELIRLALED